LPTGITAILIVPRYSVTEKKTRVIVSSFRSVRGVGQAIPGANLEVVLRTKPMPNIYRWLLEGEVETKGDFLREIAISLVPIVGDGRDILIHGMKLIRGDELGVLD